MKLSVDPASKHYIGKENFGRYDVLLNGRKVDKAFEVDTRAGKVKVYATDAAGHVLINRTKTEAVTRRLSGKVRIVDRRLSQAATRADAD